MAWGSFAAIGKEGGKKLRDYFGGGRETGPDRTGTYYPPRSVNTTGLYAGNNYNYPEAKEVVPKHTYPLEKPKYYLTDDVVEMEIDELGGSPTRGEFYRNEARLREPGAYYGPIVGNDPKTSDLAFYRDLYGEKYFPSMHEYSANSNISYPDPNMIHSTGDYGQIPYNAMFGFQMPRMGMPYYSPERPIEALDLFSRGGIASLENRPGYFWGGWNTRRRGRAEDAINRMSDYAGPSRSDLTTGKFSGGVDRPSRGEMISGPMKSNSFISNLIKEYGPSMLLANPLTNAARRGVDLYMDEDNPWGYQEGGAVGLEPGIGSLMGYAKGGMVTKMKVKKGQSKWLKKFINNMRDN